MFRFGLRLLYSAGGASKAADLVPIVATRVPIKLTPLAAVARTLPDEVMERIGEEIGGLRQFGEMYPDVFAIATVGNKVMIRRKETSDKPAMNSGPPLPAPRVDIPLPTNVPPPRYDLRGIPPFLTPLEAVSQNHQSSLSMTFSEFIDSVLGACAKALEVVDSRGQPVDAGELAKKAVEGELTSFPEEWKDYFIRASPPFAPLCHQFHRLQSHEVPIRSAYLIARFLSTVDFRLIEDVSKLMVSETNHSARHTFLSYPHLFELNAEGDGVRYILHPQYRSELAARSMEELEMHFSEWKKKKSSGRSIGKRMHVGDGRKWRRAIAEKQGSTLLDHNVMALELYLHLPEDKPVEMSGAFATDELILASPLNLQKFFGRYPELFYCFHQPPEWLVQRATIPRPEEKTVDQITDTDVLPAVLCAIPDAIDPTRPIRAALLAPKLHVTMRRWLKREGWKSFLLRYPSHFQLAESPFKDRGDTANEVWFHPVGDYGKELNEEWFRRHPERRDGGGADAAQEGSATPPSG